MADHGRFADVIGSSFARRGGPTLQLHEVSDLVEGHGTRSFSLIFHGPSDQSLDQGIHSLRHEDLGDLEVFLVPIGDRDGVRQYEAVFSTIVDVVS